jgi:hypothetical protein
MSETKRILVSQTDAAQLDSEIGAGGGVFFSRQLELIEPEILRRKTPALNGLVLFPPKTDVPEGAEKYTRRMYGHSGEAAYGGDAADNFPLANAQAESEDSVILQRVKAGYQYSTDDLAAVEMARRTGQTIQLDVERGIAARKMIETKLNQIVWKGSREHGHFGVLNHPGIPRRAMPNASTAATDTLFADLGALFMSVKSNTLEVEQPDRLILASKIYNAFSLKIRGYTDTTLLDLLAKALGIPRENIKSAWELNGAGDGGGDAVIVDRKDEWIMSHIISVFFRQEPVQRVNYAYKVPCSAKSGGMMSSYPLGMVIGSFPNAL